ncbi:hypothetical protein BGX31_008155 [Mortierella sp. GBA43]|nr:hypothetical protein BGX31_008155 [Mortierella sp. GBA43]
MVRHEKREGSILIAWGYDGPCGGYFLSVTDKRLAWASDASEQVNEIAEKVFPDGGGSYFDLNTYTIGGFGYTVSQATIFTYMRRYGIDPNKIL